MTESLSPFTLFPVRAETDFKMVLSFAIIGSIAATALARTMPERKKTGILSLNVKKLINLHLVRNTIQKLQ